MNSLLQFQDIFSKINEFHRLTTDDSDIKIKTAIQEILWLWPEILAAFDKATDDELFHLNISRAVLTQVFTIVLSKDFFENDPLLVHDIFFICFDILVNHKDIFTNNDSTPISVFMDSNVRLLVKMLTSITSLVRFKKDDYSKTGYHDLLIAMRQHIDQDFKHDNLTDEIISFIWNLSDSTILVPVLLDAGYGNSVIQWIRNREIKFRGDRSEAPIHILHNLSRHDDGIQQLSMLNALEVIENIQIEKKTYDDVYDIELHITMIRALLTDINQIQLESTKYSNNVIKMIVDLSIKAAKSEQYRHNGSHVSEPLTILVKLFYNNNILHSTLCNYETKSSTTIPSVIEMFSLLLIKFYSKTNLNDDLLDSYTCIVLFNLFWLISNHAKYCQIIRDQGQLIDIIKRGATDEQCFANTFMPRTMKSIKQSANDILRNLNSPN